MTACQHLHARPYEFCPDCGEKMLGQCSRGHALRVLSKFCQACGEELRPAGLVQVDQELKK